MQMISQCSPRGGGVGSFFSQCLRRMFYFPQIMGTIRGEGSPFRKELTGSAHPGSPCHQRDGPPPACPQGPGPERPVATSRCPARSVSPQRHALPPHRCRRRGRRAVHPCTLTDLNLQAGFLVYDFIVIPFILCLRSKPFWFIFPP